MSKASLELALIANNTKSMALSRRKAKVEFHANGVYQKREQASRPKCDVKSAAFLRVVALNQLCIDGDPTVCGSIGRETIGEPIMKV